MASPTKTLTKPRLSREEVMMIARALSDPRRFDILQQIASVELFIGCSDLLRVIEITPATMSHHLRELETAGLISVVRDGKFMQMRLRRDIWKAYLAELKRI